MYTNPTTNSARRDLRALDEQRDIVSKKAWGPISGGETYRTEAARLYPMPAPASPPTGLGNDQEGGGDGEGIWEPREREGEERGWRWARINRRRQSTCSLSF
jgi:hypothetical protein